MFWLMRIAMVVFLLETAAGVGGRWVVRPAFLAGHVSHRLLYGAVETFVRTFSVGFR
jgi:hypothetical protein